jgi:phage terminase Nu1 subunit (DNA packaging protein)
MATVTVVSEATRRKLDHIPGELHREFPQVPVEKIDDIVDTLAVRLLVAARFEDFVPLLTHRHARERLLRESAETY